MKQQIVHIQHDRVPNQLPGVRRDVEKFNEMLQPHELAAENPFADRKILKSDNDAVHGHILEDNVI